MTSMSRMSYLHKPHTSPMSHRLLFEHLDEQASMYPDKEALVYRDEHFRRKTITFKQYQQRSHALAARLLELGLRRGDAAISMLPGDIEYMVVNMALNRIGVNAVIIEPNADGTLPFLENIKNIKAVICCDQFPGVISAVQGFIHRKSIKVAIVVGIAPEGDQRLYSYEDLVQQGDDTSSALKQAQAEVQMDDHALVIFTSGSTGIPKPIQFTNHGFVNSSIFSAPKLKASSESIFFCDAPFDWITGLSVSTLVAIVGCTVVSFPPKVAFKSEMTGTLLRCVAEERATHAVFISYFMMSILEYDGLDTASLSALQYISTGGQPIDPTLLKRVFQALPALCEIQIVYAATEFNVLATCDVTRENIDSDEYGYLDCHEGTELKVVDSEGHLVPVGTPGELYIRTAAMLHDVDTLGLEGYQRSTTPTGWQRTKDHAFLTANRKFKLLGRIDNLIKCASESIQPTEVESVLTKHPNVVSVVAVGVPDQRLYEVVCACVILKNLPGDDVKVTTAEIDDWCKGKFLVDSVGISAHPTYYVVFEKFPTTGRGKTDRKTLKKLAAEKLGL